MIDMTKNYRTRDGREVTLLAVVDKLGGYPVVGHGKDEDGQTVVMRWTKNGGYYYGGTQESKNDLVEIKPRIRVWVNLFPNGAGSFFSSREEADKFSIQRIACVEIDVEHGHGLTEESSDAK